jgi:hypothetical protein
VLHGLEKFEEGTNLLIGTDAETVKPVIQFD